METYDVSQARNQNAYWVEGADINSQFTSPNFEQSGVMNNEGAPEFVDQSMYYPAGTNYGYDCTGKPKMQLNKEQWLVTAILSSIAQVTLMSALGYPYQKDTILLSFGQACFHLLPAILWNVFFVVTFVYAFVSIVQLTPSWAFRVPILGMLCLNFVYGLFKWLIKASRFNVLYYSLRINGALFMSVGVLGFLILDMIVLFFGGDFDEKVEE